MNRLPVRDIRKYARQTNIRLILGGVLLLFLVGDGLIWILKGSQAAISGLLCMGLGLVPLILIGVVLILLDWIVRRANSD